MQQQDLTETHRKGMQRVLDVCLQCDVLHIGTRIIAQGAEREIQSIFIGLGVQIYPVPPLAFSQFRAVDAHQLQKMRVKRQIYGRKKFQLPPGGDKGVFSDGLPIMAQAKR